MARPHAPHVPAALPLAPPPRSIGTAHVVVAVVGAATLLPWISPGMALAAGIVLALAVGNPLPEATRLLARRLLTGSIVGLGAGTHLGVVARAGLSGLGVAAFGIALALALGVGLGRLLGVTKHASLLVTVGTAICGGSAIAAASPAIGAKEEDVSVALVTVFVLNAVALYAFPVVGHAVGLDPSRFGLWCALAIHDTSSVVGAATGYDPGTVALEIATAAKLARALWIVPVTLALSLHARRHPAAGTSDRPRMARPTFILGFLAAAALVTVVPALAPAGKVVASIAHRGLALTLFAIGLGLTRPALARVGVKPFVQGLVLWSVLAAASLAAIVGGWIG